MTISDATCPIRIFLAEDNPGDVLLLKEALSANGVNFALDRYADGEQCLQRLIDEADPVRADLIIVDLNLPRVDGLQLLSAIRANRRFDGTPVVVLTSSQSPHDRKCALDLKADAFLSKPPMLEDFIQKIGSSLRAVVERKRPPHSCSARASQRKTTWTSRSSHLFERLSLRIPR